MADDQNTNIVSYSQQQESYVTWANSHLKIRDPLLTIDSLQADTICDGTALGHLVEIVSGRTVANLIAQPVSVEEKEHNIEILVAQMARWKVKMHTVQPTAIVNGDIKSIMRLILALAAHFKPTCVRPQPSSSFTNVNSPGSSTTHTYTTTKSIQLRRTDSNNSSITTPTQSESQRQCKMINHSDLSSSNGSCSSVPTTPTSTIGPLQLTNKNRNGKSGRPLPQLSITQIMQGAAVGLAKAKDDILMSPSIEHRSKTFTYAAPRSDLWSPSEEVPKHCTPLTTPLSPHPPPIKPDSLPVHASTSTGGPLDLTGCSSTDSGIVSRLTSMKDDGSGCSLKHSEIHDMIQEAGDMRSMLDQLYAILSENSDDSGVSLSPGILNNIDKSSRSQSSLEQEIVSLKASLAESEEEVASWRESAKYWRCCVDKMTSSKVPAQINGEINRNDLERQKLVRRCQDLEENLKSLNLSEQKKTNQIACLTKEISQIQVEVVETEKAKMNLAGRLVSANHEHEKVLKDLNQRIKELEGQIGPSQLRDTITIKHEPNTPSFDSEAVSFCLASLRKSLSQDSANKAILDRLERSLFPASSISSKKMVSSLSSNHSTPLSSRRSHNALSSGDEAVSLSTPYSARRPQNVLPSGDEATHQSLSSSSTPHLPIRHHSSAFKPFHTSPSHQSQNPQRLPPSLNKQNSVESSLTHQRTLSQQQSSSNSDNSSTNKFRKSQTMDGIDARLNMPQPLYLDKSPSHPPPIHPCDVSPSSTSSSSATNSTVHPLHCPFFSSSNHHPFIPASNHHPPHSINQWQHAMSSTNPNKRLPISALPGFPIQRLDSSYVDDASHTKLIYFIEHAIAPYMVAIPKRSEEVCLDDVKQFSQHTKPGFRFIFKSLDKEYGPVKEELSRDCDLVPHWEGKVIVWIHRDPEG